MNMCNVPYYSIRKTHAFAYLHLHTFIYEQLPSSTNLFNKYLSNIKYFLTQRVR